MDNKAIAGLLYETADLLEIDGQDSFRVRSYRNAAEAIEALPQQVASLIQEPKKLLEVQGIGKGMLANLQMLFKDGRIEAHAELLKKYRPSMLELLKIQGLGPKTIALIWSAYQVSDLEGVEKLAREGKIRELPRMGEKHELKLLKAIEDYRRIAGRFLLDTAEELAEKLTEHLLAIPGIEKVTPAGSLRRGRETVGDLDILVTGKGCVEEESRQKLIEHLLRFPGLMDVIAQGENKVSFRHRNGMQVDVRLLPPESFGAAMQYFTGSKAHNVALRQRALKMGFTLNEYSLATLEDNQPVARKTEEEIYAKLGLDYIEPELREMTGEIESAESHKLPQLIKLADIRGDLQMHTTASDGRNSIQEMGEAAKKLGYEYIALTDHSKAVTVANGMDDKRTLAQIKKIRAAQERVTGIRLLAGIEVDILKNGSLDLSNEVLVQLDVVVASIHSFMNLDREAMTDRILAAIENPYTQILAHPTGRLLLRRESFTYDIEEVLEAAKKNGVAVECNAYPDRLDFNDVHLRMARERGVKVVISTDAHSTAHFRMMKYGVITARRGWLEKKHVLNTLPLNELLASLRPKPAGAVPKTAKSKSA